MLFRSGCKLYCISSFHNGNVGTSLVISSVAANGFQVVVDGTFAQPPHAADIFTIIPGIGASKTIAIGTLTVPSPDSFASWGMFLPWTPNEGQTTLTALSLASTTNPYPPGFDYPNTHHILPAYRTGSGQGIVYVGI